MQQEAARKIDIALGGRLDACRGPDLSNNPMVEYHCELVAAGIFEVAGGAPANHVARWDGSTWKPLGAGLQGNTYALAYDLALYGDLLVVTGDFNRAGGVETGGVAFWDGNAWSAAGTASSGGTFTGAVVGAASVGNTLLVTGIFSQIGTASVLNIARWDGNSWSALGSGLNGIGVRMAIWDGDLYVGGWFIAAGGKQSSTSRAGGAPSCPSR